MFEVDCREGNWSWSFSREPGGSPMYSETGLVSEEACQKAMEKFVADLMKYAYRDDFGRIVVKYTSLVTKPDSPPEGAGYENIDTGTVGT